MKRLHWLAGRLASAWIVGVCLLLPGLALAAGQNEEPGIINLNVTILIQVINFLILIFLLSKFLFKPLTTFLADRSAGIARSLARPRLSMRPNDNLVLGICNGFQILANLGLVPAFDRKFKRDIALMPNRKGVLECGFVTLKPVAENLWTRGIERIYCPVSHGEGNFYCSPETLERLKGKNLIAFRYCHDDLSPANGEYPSNPNGSVEDIAGITSEDGKVLGLMPHPERAMDFTSLYDW